MLKVNEYFDGQVKSIAIHNAKGYSTVGVIAAGEYTFSTDKKEVMHIVCGQLSVNLTDQSGWTCYTAGQQFEVPSQSKFSVRTKDDCAYWCEYLS